MPEGHGRRSPLAHLGLAARARGARPENASESAGETAGVLLGERAFRGQITLRGVADDPAFGEAVQGALGAALPVDANTTAGRASLAEGPRILWLGPDEWLVVTAPGAEPQAMAALRDALRGRHTAVVDVSDGRTVIVLSGPDARRVLAKGCPLDLHPRAFGPGRCAQSLLAKAHVILHQVDDAPTYEIYVHRSFADYLWAWLSDAASEYGVGATA